jgi:hypothetical protein
MQKKKNVFVICLGVKFTRGGLVNFNCQFDWIKKLLGDWWSTPGVAVMVFPGMIGVLT